MKGTNRNTPFIRNTPVVDVLCLFLSKKDLFIKPQIIPRFPFCDNPLRVKAEESELSEFPVLNVSLIVLWRERV